MRRTVAALALGLSVLSVAPADAGCVEDFLAPEKDPALRVSDVVGTVQVGDDYSVTVSAGWAVAAAGRIANNEIGDATTFVACVV